MPYPRYSSGTSGGGGGDYGRRNDGYGAGPGGQPSPWQTAASGPGLLPTPGGSRGNDLLTGNLFGSLLGPSAGGNPNALANLAGQLAVAQAAVSMNNSGGGPGPGISPFSDAPRLRPASPPSYSSSSSSRRGGGRSPPRRSGGYSSSSSRRSRSRSRDRGSRSRPRKRARESSPPKDRAEYEIYIGNYPVRFREEDLRSLFKEHNIEVKTIRLKHDGNKVFGFAETINREEIEKAVKALDSKEINGRRLRVRAAGDKEKKPGDSGYREKSAERDRDRDRGGASSSGSSRRSKKEVRVSDVKGHLAYAFIGFLQRERDEVDVAEEKKEKMNQAIEILKDAFDIPDDDSLKVSRHLEIMFLQNNRREIKVPESEPEKATGGRGDSKPKEEEDSAADATETKEPTASVKVEAEDDQDDGNWKRKKTSVDDEDDDREDEAALEAANDLEKELDDVGETFAQATEEEENEPSHLENLDAMEAEEVNAPEAAEAPPAESFQEEEEEEEEAADEPPEELEEEAVPPPANSGRGRVTRSRRGRT